MIFAIIALLLLGVVGAAYLTNPFTRFSIIRRPYEAEMVREVLRATDRNHKLRVRQGLWWRVFAYIKCGIHILNTRYIRSPRSSGETIEEIIADIHKLRYDPNKLLLISGDHFSALFVRNLGVFYYPMLDVRIASNKEDWQRRQLVYIQTVAYALGAFAKYPTPTTTIVSTGAYRATCVNFYAYPSDTVYGILYALAALLGLEQASPVTYRGAGLRLQTKPAAKQLLGSYNQTLRALYANYRQHIYNPESGLVRTDVHLSGAKDITRRRSAFYDNVIFWKTTQLAGTLGLIEPDQAFLDSLKATILRTFWLEDEGYFLEDLSDEGLARKYYSSDWLIVLATGFLDPSKESERHYFTRSILHIQKHGIDKPFAIKYQNDTRAHRQFLAVRLAVASYGGDAIWSFWGMEYIKSLLLLYKVTGDKKYLRTADMHIAAYEKAMLRDGGFPEVYDKHGVLLETPFYRSIRQTGWVIGFEQVRALRKSLM